jgi:hypothetical protein
MSELIAFVDANGRRKTASSIRLIRHPIRDAINNTTFDELWVEIHVVGRIRGGWTEYMRLEDFVRLNPELARRLSER